MEAKDTLSKARRGIQVALQDPKKKYRAALTAAYNAMRDAEKMLRDDSSEESEPDLEPPAEQGSRFRLYGLSSEERELALSLLE